MYFYRNRRSPPCIRAWILLGGQQRGRGMTMGWTTRPEGVGPSLTAGSRVGDFEFALAGLERGAGPPISRMGLPVRPVLVQGRRRRRGSPARARDYRFVRFPSSRWRARRRARARARRRASHIRARVRRMATKVVGEVLVFRVRRCLFLLVHPKQQKGPLSECQQKGPFSGMSANRSVGIF